MITDGLECCDVFIRLSFWRHPFTAEHPLTHSDGTHSLQSIHWLSFWRHPFTAEHPLALILTAPIHCRASIDSFWRHPFTAEHPLTHCDGTHSLQGIHWLSFWRHPFTAEHPLALILTAPIHCRASIDTFPQTWWRNEFILILDEHIFCTIYIYVFIQHMLFILH